MSKYLLKNISQKLPQRKSLQILSLLIFVFSLSAIYTLAFLQAENVLFNNPDWYPYKSKQIKFNLLASIESSMTRTLIGGNQFNLGAFYGGNEILSKHEVKLQSLSFNFILMPNSYLDVVYNYNDKTHSFVRFSTSSIFPSGIHKALRSGEYLSSRSFDLTLKPYTKYHGELRRSDKGIALYIDKTLVAAVSSDFEFGSFGFKSGLLGAIVSSAKAIDVEDKIVGTSIYNFKNGFRYFLIHSLFFLIIIVMFSIVLKRINKNYQSALVSFLSFLLFFGILWNVYDFFYYSKQSVTWDVVENQSIAFEASEGVPDFEKLRYEVFAAWERWVGSRNLTFTDLKNRYGEPLMRVKENYCHNDKCEYLNTLPEKNSADKQAIRFGILGASFIAGTGLEETDETIFSQTHKTIYEGLHRKVEVESFNFHMYEINLKNNKDLILSWLKKYKINYLIITHRINFKKNLDQVEGLKQIMQMCSQEGIKVFYLDNLKNPEHVALFASKFNMNIKLANKESDSKTYEISDVYLSELEKNYDLTVLRPNYFFHDEKVLASGDLWWDRYHMTGHGEKVFGTWLGEKFNEYLKSRHDYESL